MASKMTQLCCLIRTSHSSRSLGGTGYFLRWNRRNNPLKIIPDKCFPFTFDEKEKWHFFLVEEDFVYEHLCFFFADYAEAVKFFKSVDN